jgi:hypothetical protein
MYRRLLSSVALTLLTASTLPAQDWARNLFTTTEHDFGSVAQGAKADWAFTMTNKYQDDIHIASVRTSCGCTTPYVANDKHTLKTYETGAIIAHLNSATHLGQRAATLTVTIDRPYYAEVQLQIRALVHSNVLMAPASLQFGTVEQGKPKEARVHLYRADFPNWQIQSVYCSDPNLQGQAVLLARQNGQVWYDVVVRLAAGAASGYISDHFTLTTNDPGMRQMPIQVEGQVQPTVVVSPADLFLGVMHSGDKVTKPLVVRADKPFRIKSITGDKAAFVIAKPSSEASTMHVVPVTFVAGAEIGKVVKTIHIETDLGDARATSYAVVDDVVR